MPTVRLELEQEVVSSIGKVITVYAETHIKRQRIRFWNICTVVSALTLLVLAICSDLTIALEEENNEASPYALPPAMNFFAALAFCLIGGGYHIVQQRENKDKLNKRERKASQTFRSSMMSGSKKIKDKKKDIVFYFNQLGKNDIIQRKIAGREGIQSIIIRLGKITGFTIIISYVVQKTDETNKLYEYTTASLGMLLGVLFVVAGLTRLMIPSITALRERIENLPIVDSEAVPRLQKQIADSRINEETLRVALSC